DADGEADQDHHGREVRSTTGSRPALVIPPRRALHPKCAGWALASSSRPPPFTSEVTCSTENDQRVRGGASQSIGWVHRQHTSPLRLARARTRAHSAR